MLPDPLREETRIAMTLRVMTTALCVTVLAGVATAADVPPIPPGEKEPVLQVQAEGPIALVNALAFSPDGKTLYAAGFDKVVHVWNQDRTGRWTPATQAYRVPIGPGIYGAINALAVSPDGQWLAVAGLMLQRDLAGFRQEDKGFVRPRSSLTDAMWRDVGTIYLFNTTNGDVRPLRGHLGPVLALAFTSADARLPNQPPLLVSAGRDRDLKEDKY